MFTIITAPSPSPPPINTKKLVNYPLPFSLHKTSQKPKKATKVQIFLPPTPYSLLPQKHPKVPLLCNSMKKGFGRRQIGRKVERKKERGGKEKKRRRKEDVGNNKKKLSRLSSTSTTN
jgi:hypothetical protein